MFFGINTCLLDPRGWQSSVSRWRFLRFRRFGAGDSEMVPHSAPILFRIRRWWPSENRLRRVYRFGIDDYKRRARRYAGSGNAANRSTRLGWAKRFFAN